MITKKQVVEWIAGADLRPVKTQGTGHASVNIALCKYWGKRDEALNLPVTSSLSVSLPGLEAHTVVRPADEWSLRLNREVQDAGGRTARRVFDYLALFSDEKFAVESESTVPLAAGLASSASGFAALARAAVDLFDVKIGGDMLSVLARLGSGSACRSVYEGFVEWQAGIRADGMDSHAVPLGQPWPSLRVGLLLISSGCKKTGSRDAMRRTCETSSLYTSWPHKVEQDLCAIREAIKDRDFERLGRHAESNALGMHATMLDSWPPVVYWLPESLEAIHGAHALREQGVPVYFTMDAGPNVKLLYEADSEEVVKQRFPAMRTIVPFP